MDVGQLIADAGRIVVAGDVMLDLYLSGKVGRISPEAPVPVLQHVSETAVAGGAANVALNLAAVGARATLVGVVGDDAEGRRLSERMAAAGIGDALVADPARPTTVKTRVLAGRQHQFLRIDREVTTPLPPSAEDAMIAALEAALDGASALILSDYAKGCFTDRVLSHAIQAGRARGLPVLVDPKRPDFAAYAGASVIKPNLAETAAATGIDCATDAGVEAAARAIVAQTGASLLVTMSERGMRYFPADATGAVSMPTRARDVFDVSGAGDTVIALFAAMLAGGASRRQAMHVANVAAGLVVSKAGTATVTAAELARGLTRDASETAVPRGPLLSWEEARALRERWREGGLQVGFTNGCFDLLHPGHVRILQGARETCDKLIVGLNADASVRRLKGMGRPVQDEAARAEVVGAIAGVDGVVLFDQDTPLELITELVPDVLIKGADYAEADIVGGDVVRAGGGRVERVPLKEGHSTTRLVARARGS